MNKFDLKSLILSLFIILLGFLFGIVGSDSNFDQFPLSPFYILIGIVFLLQWIVFIPSYLLKTEKYFDLTGGITYVSVGIIALTLNPKPTIVSIVLTLLVVIWALRLSIFLFSRVRKYRKDQRFDNIKQDPLRFFLVWNIQAIWIIITAGAVLAGILKGDTSISYLFYIGIFLWLCGFTIEVIADKQKSNFKADSKNKGKFIRTGLWSWSRHPNYFGEILLWFGIAVATVPILQGLQYFTLISPFFVTFLLLKVSGVPILEKQADEKWGGDLEYENYKLTTPVLFPKKPE